MVSVRGLPSMALMNISLFPIMLAVMVWGREWAGLHLHCSCDNEAVVASRYSRSSDVMHLLCCLFF